MLRNPNLIPLSHQHQHALALCVRIERGVEAGKTDPAPWLAEIEGIYLPEIAVHFAAEETVVFPAAARLGELRTLVTDLLSEHGVLRDLFSQAAARQLDANGLRRLGQMLSRHIRKEERQLFEGMQRQMSAVELAEIGAALEKQLAATSDACILPSEATALRPRSE